MEAPETTKEIKGVKLPATAVDVTLFTVEHDQLKWYACDALPLLGFDHEKIIAYVIERLQSSVL